MAVSASEFSLRESLVIALDLRGHGLSDAPAHGYDMPQLRSDLETALDLLNVKGKFVLVGHSFGGAIVTDYAVAHPDRVERLVLIATPGEFKLSRLFASGLALPEWLLRPVTFFLRKRLAAPPHVLKAFYREKSRYMGGVGSVSAAANAHACDPRQPRRGVQAGFL